MSYYLSFKTQILKLQGRPTIPPCRSRTSSTP
nr:MAG TPA: hypothetical protein [Caudoviricetes sp.]